MLRVSFSHNLQW